MSTTARRVGMGCGLLALAVAIIWLCAERQPPPAPPQMPPPAIPRKVERPEPPHAVPKPAEKAPLPAAAQKPTPKESRTAALKREIGKLNVSEAVRTVIGLGERPGGFNERAAALRKLTRTLPADDAKALTMFLDFRAGEQDPQSRLATLEFEGLKNDALVILLAQKDLPTGLGGQLVAMSRDAGMTTCGGPTAFSTSPSTTGADGPPGPSPRSRGVSRKRTRNAWTWRRLAGMRSGIRTAPRPGLPC